MTIGPTTSRTLSHRLATEQATRRLPSIVAGLVRDGELVWSDAVGTVDGRADGALATTDTQYRIGSISKTFVAVEVLRLRDASQIDLGDTIGKHLSEVPFGQVTIAQLLSHSAGLQAETDGDWWERTEGDSWQALLDSGVGLRFTPGTRFHYSNVGYAILGELVARLRGEPWQDAVRTGILEPLGMTRTTMRPVPPAAQGFGVHPLADLLHVEPEHDAVAMAPAGQLWSTVDDMSAWAAFLGGRTGDVLRPETLTEMLHPIVVNDLVGSPWTGAHALGWQRWNVAGRGYAGHGGSMPGFLAGLRVDIDSGDGIVLMTNATSGLGAATSELLNLFAEREPITPKPWHVDSTQAALLDLTGQWFWGTSSYTLSLGHDGELRLGTPGEARGARFRPTGEGWIGLDGYYAGEPLRAERDDSGRVVRLVLASFVFSRTPYDPAAGAPGGIDAALWH